MKTLQSSMLLLLLAAGCTDAYKPVIIMHGILSDSTGFVNLSDFITEAHPGTQVMMIDIYNNAASLEPMWKQVRGFSKVLSNIMRSYPDGVHLLCFSQGGLICRGALSTMPDHNVHSFIALSSPLAGQCGEPNDVTQAFPDSVNRMMHPICHKNVGQHMSICNYWKETTNPKPMFPDMKDTVHRFCYNKLGQQVSLCNYWNDPHHRERYLRSNNFLPVLNGEKSHSKMRAWKENFLRIKKLVLIGGPDDNVIIPWQSSFFGFYDTNKHIVEMKNQEFYQDDTFGLRALDERGDISVCIRSGVKHNNWHSNFTVFMSCMEEWLT